MTWQATLTLLVTLGALGTMALTRWGAHWIMLSALAILSVSGILTPAQALAGFANPGLITVAALFVVAAGVQSTGGVTLLIDHLLGRPSSVRGAMVRLLAPTIGASALLNNTPVVATLIPAVLAWSRRIGIAPSQLLIPLSYGAMLGGTLTLIGTSTNLVVNSQYQELSGEAGFSLFAISLVGLPVMVVGVALMLWRFPRWLPTHQQQQPFANLREFTLEVSVDPQGPLVGKTVAAAGLRHLPDLYLVEIERDGHIVTAVPSEEKLAAGDRLVFAGATEAVTELLRIKGIVPSPENGDSHLLQEDRTERRLVEAVVSPHCDALGQAIRDARFRDRYGAVVLAVARGGERIKGNLGNTRLQAGDTLLLEARPAFVTRQRYNRDFLLINAHRDEPVRHHRGLVAWFIVALMVTVAATGVLSMLNAALLAAVAMVVTGCCSPGQAERSLDGPVLLTIAAAFALGAAWLETGLAEGLVAHLLAWAGNNPWLLLAFTYAGVSILTELITNNAAAILVLPVVLTLCEQAGLATDPFVLAIMMAGSASFATPLGYQTNLMVYGPGQYRLGDFWRVGWRMNILVGFTTVLVLGTVWPLTV